MGMTIDTVSHTSVMKDLYPGPGTTVKQWVVDTWRESRWERETCPVVSVPLHDDNCGCQCRNAGQTRWLYLAHDSCYYCNDLYDAHVGDLDIAAWQMERASRPPICADPDRLSDEIGPPLPILRDNPVLKSLRKP